MLFVGNKTSDPELEEFRSKFTTKVLDFTELFSNFHVYLIKYFEFFQIFSNFFEFQNFLNFFGV